MVKRKIIKIDEKKCNGCGVCIPACPEGALQVIDGKVRLVSDLFCDGLGACLGECPVGALKVIEREAEPYNETKVMARIAKQGNNVVKAHLEHLKEHGETAYLDEAIAFLKKKKISIPISISSGIPSPSEQMMHHGGCPGSRMVDMRQPAKKIPPLSSHAAAGRSAKASVPSELRQWPVQLSLLSPYAPYFKGADLLITADCVPFAFASYHDKLLAGKAVAIGCPKMDDVEEYIEKISAIISSNDIKSVTVAIMEVPCCGGLYHAVESAISQSGKDVLLKRVVIGIDGSMR